MAKCEMCGNDLGFFDTNICETCAVDLSDLETASSNPEILLEDAHYFYDKFSKLLPNIQNADLKKHISDLVENLSQKIKTDEAEAKKQCALAEAKAVADAAKQKACSAMLITSGFNFDGYKITKYSGYISGDDAIEVNRQGIFGTGPNAADALTGALVKIRRKAIAELKEAAYDLGCNAVIGVDFDYITLEPETANITGGTTYLPYVFCVTANGNAVIIEKDED